MNFKHLVLIAMLLSGVGPLGAAEASWEADQNLDRRLGLLGAWRLPSAASRSVFRPTEKVLTSPLPPYAQQPLGASEASTLGPRRP